MRNANLKYLFILGLGLAPFAMGGCELECNGSNDVENVVDEIGDEVEDVADKLDDGA